MIVEIQGQLYKIRTKKEILSENFQLILSKAYHSRSKNRCVSCNVDMYISKVENRYYLKSYPKKAGEHKENCVFYKNGIENFISEENIEINIKSEAILFKTTPTQKTTDIQVINKAERKIKNFNHLIFILLDEAYAKAFNIVNKGKKRLSGEIVNPETELVGYFLKKELENLKIKGKTIKEILKEKQVFFKTGEILSSNKRQDKSYRYFDGMKSWIIPEYVWEQAVNIAKIYTNIISPPYFYLRLSGKRKVYRFFILPVASEKIFIPVESDLERKVANKILKKDYGIYKPMTTLHTKQILTKQIAKDYFRFVPPDIRPDFFVFKKDKIGIIEVVDKNNLKIDKYRERLEYKESCYSRLPSYFEYIRIQA